MPPVLAPPPLSPPLPPLSPPRAPLASLPLAPAPLPAPPLAHVTAADGTRLRVRAMLRSDGPALAEAVAALSPETRYRRFLTPKPALSRREVAALTDLDHHAREALVAIEPATGAWVAVARYAAFPDDPLTADIAITVADAWQRRGVGGALVALLVERARAEGLTRLSATTLAGNVPALRLLRRQGFERLDHGADPVELALDLTALHTS